MMRFGRVILLAVVLGMGLPMGVVTTSATPALPPLPILPDIESAPRAAQVVEYQWAYGSFNTFATDGSNTPDSTIYFYVNYARNGPSQLHIRWILVTEPGESEPHIWTKSCYNFCRYNYDLACKVIPTDTWAYEQVDWHVVSGRTFHIWATNRIWITGLADCSGLWGETWTGSATLR
jgi:hypothetical protein